MKWFVGQRVKLARGVHGVSGVRKAKVHEGVIFSIGYFPKGAPMAGGGVLPCHVDCYCRFGDQEGSCQFDQLEPLSDSNQLVTWESMRELWMPSDLRATERIA